MVARGIGAPRRVARGPARCGPRPASDRVYRVAAEVLGAVRKAKSDAQRSLRTEVVRAVVRDTPERLAALDAAARPTCGTPAGSRELVTEAATRSRSTSSSPPPDERTPG